MFNFHMKAKIAHGIGWLLIAVCIGLILFHGYNYFIEDHPPYNASKSHIEIGVVGLLIWFAAQHLIRYRDQNTDLG